LSHPGRNRGIRRHWENNMAIVSNCPQCKTKVSVKDEMAGKKIACPKCKKGVIHLPSGTQATKPAAGRVEQQLAAAKDAPTKSKFKAGQMDGAGAGISAKSGEIVSDGKIDPSEIPELDDGAGKELPGRCPKCGRPIAIGRVNCTNCGWDPRVKQVEKKKSLGIVPYVAGGVVLAAIAAFVIIRFAL